jgi:putative membrane protein
VIVTAVWLAPGTRTATGSLPQIHRNTRAVAAERDIGLPITMLPAVNAALNVTSAALLCLGYFFIRRRHIHAHKACMVAAVVVSALFLVSYVTYHIFAGSTPFLGQGLIRIIYLVVLIPHVVLSILLIPFVIVVLRRGFMRNDRKHTWLAQRVLPLWIYTSATGIVVYVMLYYLF